MSGSSSMTRIRPRGAFSVSTSGGKFATVSAIYCISLSDLAEITAGTEGDSVRTVATADAAATAGLATRGASVLAGAGGTVAFAAAATGNVSRNCVPRPG